MLITGLNFLSIASVYHTGRAASSAAELTNRAECVIVSGKEITRSRVLLCYFPKRLEIRPGLTAVMGSGGKTSLVCRLADELSAARVIIATSTHMRQVPALQTRVGTVAPGTPAIVGTPCGDGKFGPPEQSWAELCELADYVLVEADGSRGLPLKAHLSHEPVLPQEAGQVIAVLGLTGLGRPIAEAAHRPERYAGLAGCAPEDIATPERATRVLETEALHTRVLLNQADAADGTACWTGCTAGRPRQLTKRRNHIMLVLIRGAGDLASGIAAASAPRPSIRRHDGPFRSRPPSGEPSAFRRPSSTAA